jgi:hypothetical protein
MAETKGFQFVRAAAAERVRLCLELLLVEFVSSMANRRLLVSKKLLNGVFDKVIQRLVSFDCRDCGALVQVCANPDIECTFERFVRFFSNSLAGLQIVIDGRMKFTHKFLEALALERDKIRDELNAAMDAAILFGDFR